MKQALLTLGLAALLTAVTASAQAAEPVQRLPDGSLQLPVEAQRRLDIRTQLTQAGEAAASLTLPGRVVMDPNAGGRVQALAGGRLQGGPQGLPLPGQRVRAGEVLAYVAYGANPVEAANQQAQLAELRSQRQLAAQRLARLESLEGTVPRKEIDAARAELASLTAREQAVAPSVGAREALRAPLSGLVASSNAVAGQVVEPRELVFEIVDPARVLIEASTADATLAAQLQPRSTAQLVGVPEAQLQFLGSARALRDGLLTLHFRAGPAKGQAALPVAIGQPVQVIVALPQSRKGVVLPAAALTRSSANEPQVWLKLAAERFVPQPVQAQPLDASTVLVTQGLAADQRVVVQGAALLSQFR